MESWIEIWEYFWQWLMTHNNALAQKMMAHHNRELGSLQFESQKMSQIPLVWTLNDTAFLNLSAQQFGSPQRGGVASLSLLSIVAPIGLLSVSFWLDQQSSLAYLAVPSPWLSSTQWLLLTQLLPSPQLPLTWVIFYPNTYQSTRNDPSAWIKMIVTLFWISNTKQSNSSK